MTSLKIVYKEEIRRVRAPAAMSMAEILRLVKQLFPTLREAQSLKLTYCDDEGDTVALNSNEELVEALGVMALQSLKVLRFKVVAEDAPNSCCAPGNAIHQDVTCDGCGVGPIMGIRYKCTVRDDYDLCSCCEAKQDHQYPMLKVYVPTSLPRQGAYIVDHLVSSVTGADKRGENRTPVHRHVRCDGCGALPIVGSRYKCTQRRDYDLCESCHTKDKSGFYMTKIDVPAGGRWGMCAKRAAKRCNGDSRPPIHRHVQCDGCGMYPLVGTRYNCSVRPNYDLCESCKEKEAGKYPMNKIEASCSGSGSCRGGKFHNTSAPWRKKCTPPQKDIPNEEAPAGEAVAKEACAVAAAVLGNVMMTTESASASLASAQDAFHSAPTAAPVQLTAATHSCPAAPDSLAAVTEPAMPAAAVPDQLNVQSSDNTLAELRSLEDSLLEAALKESVALSVSPSEGSNPVAGDLSVANPVGTQTDEASAGSLTPSEGFEAFHMLRMEEIANACSDDEAEERRVVGVALATTEADASDARDGQAGFPESTSMEGHAGAAVEGEKWRKELALLAEMGFTERSVVVSQLEAVAGCADHTAEGDLPADALNRVIAALVGVNQL